MDHTTCSRATNREERLRWRRELYRLRRDHETTDKGIKDYEYKEKMPEEDMLSSQSNKGKKICSEEDNISVLLYFNIV